MSRKTVGKGEDKTIQDVQLEYAQRNSSMSFPSVRVVFKVVYFLYVERPRYGVV